MHILIELSTFPNQLRLVFFFADVLQRKRYNASYFGWFYLVEAETPSVSGDNSAIVLINMFLHVREGFFCFDIALGDLQENIAQICF